MTYALRRFSGARAGLASLERARSFLPNTVGWTWAVLSTLLV